MDPVATKEVGIVAAKFVISLSSEEHGQERLRYGSVDEAVSGLRRMVETAVSLDDGVTRTLTLIATIEG